VRYTISVPFERFAALKAMIDEPEEPFKNRINGILDKLDAAA
jgi:hypothetical protein